MFKILKTKVTPFGGLHIIHKLLNTAKASQFIDIELGTRRLNSKYRYSDILLSRIYTAFCGGSATEDVNYLRKNTLQYLKGISIPSADTILRTDKELATESQEISTTSKKGNLININDKMNRFLVRSTIKFNQIDPKNKELTYDFDHQFIPCEKSDAQYSYKNAKGYFSAIASIENNPVYIEGRNGNCSVKNNQLDTHKRALKELNDNQIFPKYARMDSGSYLKEVTDFFHSKGIFFFIRANQSSQFLLKASQTENWKQCTINNQDLEVNSFMYEFGNYTHRIVAYRFPNKTKEINIFTQDANKYLFIITNDQDMDEQEVITFYNQRGASERLFDIQNNDFNWKNMPHSFLHQNTSYLIIMAFAHILYRYVLQKLTDLGVEISVGSRLKKFIFRLVTIPAKFTKSGRKHYVHLATQNKALIDFANSS